MATRNFHASTFCVLCCLAVCFLHGLPVDTQAQRVESHVTVTVDGFFPIVQVDDDYICATLDWWPPEKCDYGTCSWGHASLLNLNLTDPLLENAVKAFSPLKIRLGGTLQDKVIYHIGQPIDPCIPFTKNQSAMFGFSGGCLPMWRWDALNHFFQRTRSEVVFGLNALYGRPQSNGIWNSTNARDFIEHTVDRGYKIQAWEFGNELSGSGVGRSISAKQYAADLKELNTILKGIYAGHSFRPLVIAPDGFFDKKWFQEFLQESGPNSVDIVTHHIYNLGAGVDAHLLEKILNPSYLDGEATTFGALRDTLEHYGPWASSWVGEAGGAYNSGQHLISDAFVFGFWYLDQLGMAAKFGTKSYCRQSLIGGNYGLLNTTTFQPNPDYFGALLWHRLMGGRVLATKSVGTPHLRIYAHCSKNNEGVTLVLLNIANGTQFHVNIRLNTSSSSSIVANDTSTISSNAVSGRPEKNVQSFVGIFNHLFKRKSAGLTRQEYHLTPENGDLHSQTVLLNGKALEVTGDSQIPDLVPITVSSTSLINVAPLSIVFVSLPTQVPACR